VNVRSWEPLRKLPLKTLVLCFTNLREIEVLTGIELRSLFLWGGASSLDPIKGMPLRHLALRQTRVTDLTPLRGLPLEELRIVATPVSDLTPLVDCPLRLIALVETNVKDPSPLDKIKTLEQKKMN
jgi:hypothetical protein